MVSDQQTAINVKTNTVKCLGCGKGVPLSEGDDPKGKYVCTVCAKKLGYDNG
jgi:formylmethanofuran dehydrogenase subunit E